MDGRVLIVDDDAQVLRVLTRARTRRERTNVLDANLSDGTVFFLYAPFNGDTLQKVLARVKHAGVVWRTETLD